MSLKLRRPLSRALLLAYGAVILALTILKTKFRIGYLWHPAYQHARSLELWPFEQLWTSPTWFRPLFDMCGNFLLFIPVGFLLARGLSWRIRGIVATGALISCGIETSQYLFALGHTSVDDLLFNTLGTGAGAWWMRYRSRPHTQKIMVGAIGASVLVFVLLVVLTPVYYPASELPSHVVQ
ncbi:VanZ family protein [Corynebacterium uropygiale]|uniref:VanZ family protein n=1 Tax=Corynebacterium uropygiale TaxID=1775911 RepID=A0A9X1QVB3_9CORY|nr:VanZ family protein [Corynebacterium uropygiale]MCF4007665.1 VanZ family protein [Corynebacterium uropygiale]